MNKTYRFLQYVAQGNGIKFGNATNAANVIRMDHATVLAPGSTKSRPLLVLKNSIKIHDVVKVALSCTAGTEEPCVMLPNVAELSWSSPTSHPLDGQKIVDELIAVLTIVRDRMATGFLPNTDDITVTTAE